MNIKIDTYSETLTLTPVEPFEIESLKTLVEITKLGGHPHIVHDDGSCYIYVITCVSKAEKLKHCYGVKIPIIATTPFDMYTLQQIINGWYRKAMQLTLGNKALPKTWRLCVD